MPRVITVDAKNFGAVFRAREVARTKGVRRVLYEAALAGVVIVTAEIDRQKIIDTGALKASIRVRRTPTGAELVIHAPHAGVLEAGARPHWAPLQPLIDWVTRHRAAFGMSKLKPPSRRVYKTPLGATRARLRETFYAMAKADQDADIKAIAYGIRWKIHEEGSKPHWFVRKSLPAMRDALAKILEARRAAGDEP